MVDGSTKTDDDFGDAAEEGIDSDNDEVPNKVFWGKNEKKGGSGVKKSDDDWDNPSGFGFCAMEGVDEFDDTKANKKETNDGNDGWEAVVWME